MNENDDHSIMFESAGEGVSCCDRYVVDYLIYHGYVEAAAEFLHESPNFAGTEKTEELLSKSKVLKARAKIKELILDGNVHTAEKEIRKLDENLLNSSISARFHLRKQALVELIRNSEISEAIHYAQNEIAPILYAEKKGDCTNPDTMIVSKLKEELEEAMSLMLFPETKDSPVAFLFEQNHRNSVAREINSTILRHLNYDSPPAVEVLYKACIWSEKALHKIGAERDQISFHIEKQKHKLSKPEKMEE